MPIRWKSTARRLLAAVLLAVPVLAAWACWLEPRRLVLREQGLDLPCWTGPPVRVALLSDLHVGAPGMGLDRLDRLIRTVNTARPDAILLLGDYVIQGVAGGQFVAPETIAQHLRALHAPFGVHAVLGNHDWWLDAPRVAKAFRDAGIPVLDDSAVALRAGGRETFWLAGISDFWEGRHDVVSALKPVTDAAPVIAMTHNPDIFPEVPARVCVTVAGHTHGGQVALPLIGRPVVPSRFGQRYASGHVVENGRHLFVTSGVGTSILPVRFRVPPEAVILEIRGGTN